MITPCPYTFRAWTTLSSVFNLDAMGGILYHWWTPVYCWSSLFHLILNEWVGRCTQRLWSCELGGHNHASLEIHLEAFIEQDWTCTWKPWTMEFGDALGSYDRAWLEEYFDALNLLAMVLDGGTMGDETRLICWLGIVRRYRIDHNMIRWEMEHRLLEADSRCWDAAVWHVWWTQCMLYSVNPVLSVCSTQCILHSVHAVRSGFFIWWWLVIMGWRDREV